tara:strand:- start:110 stop:280 length:171 start_codon:yes stop_codon:yes gene_type:complete
MGIRFCLMPVNIESREMLKEKEIHESSNGDYSSLIGLADQSESESQWVKLHQMFDR